MSSVPSCRRTPASPGPAPSLPVDSGQATPLAALVLVLAGLLLIPTGALIRATLDRAEARTAADAAALAGALEGEDAAGRVAEANGARLVRFDRTGDRVEVVVQVGQYQATARAVRSVEVVPPPSATGSTPEPEP